MFFFHHRWMGWMLLAVACALLVYLMNTTKTGLVPQEDQGSLMVDISAVPGNSLAETDKVMDKVQKIVESEADVDHFSRVAGYGIISGQGTSYGSIIIKLKPWSERKGKAHSIDSIMARLNGKFAQITDAQIFCMQDAMIPGYGNGNSTELYIEDKTGGDAQKFYGLTMKFVAELNKRPEVAMAYSSYSMSFPQVSVDVDAAKCKRAGVSPSDVLDALGSYCGASYVSDFNKFGKVYRVMIQASPEFRLDKHSLDNMYVRSGEKMAPLSQFVTIKNTLGAELAKRFNLYNTIPVNVSAADGYSSGQVQQAIKEVSAQTLPTGYGYEYGGMAREEASNSGGQTAFVYLMCVVLIFIILSCLYESFLLPLAVIFSVPFGLMGSFLFARIFGVENNIYLQTGVIMLIGLLAKTAILITEYAVERRRKGMGIVAAAYSAAQARFRPILMTVLCMVFGMLPLMFSSGAGANGNRSLATGVIGGMVIGTIALLFMVPLFFIVFEWLQEKVRKPYHEDDDLQSLSEKERTLVEKSKASL